MIFNRLGAKSKKEKTEEEKALEREMEQAWKLYGNEVDAFLNDTKMDKEFEKLEKSRFARPKMDIKVSHNKNTARNESVPHNEDVPISDNIKKLVEQGEIQASKARRFMLDPELKEIISDREKDCPVSEELKKLVEQGEIQGSKARRFMFDPELRKIISDREKDRPVLEELKKCVEQGKIQGSKARRFIFDPELRKLIITEPS